MIPGMAVYHAVEAMAPLYTAAALGYASVRWLRAFSDEQCAGINHFVALYAVPALIFHAVATNDPYGMDVRLIAADMLQKASVLLSLIAWALLATRRRGGAAVEGNAAPARDSPLKWVATSFSVATLPSTLIMGVPLLNGMYGPVSRGPMTQILVMQLCVWYNVVTFLYEYTAALDAGSAKIRPESAVVVAVVAAAAKDDGECDEIGDSAVAYTIATEEVSSGGADTAAVAVDVLPLSAHQKVPSVMMHVVWMVGKKVLKLPNTYASFLGLIWSLIAFKFGIRMPKIVDDSLFTIYTTTVGLSMFASGTFMARQPQFVPCGYAIASLFMVLKFLVGPVVMLLASLAVGLHGTLLHISVVQAALPLAVNSFVYAAEYKVHTDIMSTGVILGAFISLPVTAVYYILLGL